MAETHSARHISKIGIGNPVRLVDYLLPAGSPFHRVALQMSGLAYLVQTSLVCKFYIALIETQFLLHIFSNAQIVHSLGLYIPEDSEQEIQQFHLQPRMVKDTIQHCTGCGIEIIQLVSEFAEPFGIMKKYPGHFSGLPRSVHFLKILLGQTYAQVTEFAILVQVFPIGTQGL